jgi:sec-independent protein translocase protein TatA
MVVGVAMLLFGPKRIPEIGASLGKGIKEFKKSVETTKSEVFSDPVDAPAPRRESSSEVPIVTAQGSEPKRLID